MPTQLEYYLPVVMNFFRYFVMAGIPFLIFYVFFPNRFPKQKIQEKLAKSSDFWRELLHSMKAIGVFIAVGLLVWNFKPGDFSFYYSDINAYPIWWMPLSTILAIVLYDAQFYWLHRMMHHKKLFRWTHIVHHKSTNPTPLASYSFNLIEAFFEALIGIITILLIPMHPFTLLLITVIIFGYNVYAHLGFEIMPRWFRHSFLFEVLNTSVHHNMHHHKSGGNYGLYFRVWDRLMQTEFPDYVQKYDELQARRFGATGAQKWEKGTKSTTIQSKT